MDFRSASQQPALFHSGVTVAVNGEMIVRKQLRLALIFQDAVRFRSYFGAGMAIGRLVAVAQDMFFPVVFDMDVHVPFRMQKDFFLSGQIFDAQLVKAARPVAAGGRHASEDGARLVLRQLIRGQVAPVIDPARDDGSVRIAFQKGDDDFMPDARQGHCAEFRSGPALRNPYPAAGVFVPLSFSIPEKLHLYPPVGVRVDLLVGGAGDNGGLNSRDSVSGMRNFRHIADSIGDGRHGGGIAHSPIRGLMFQHLRLFALMGDAGYPPARVELRAFMSEKGKGEARQKTGNVGLGFQT